MYLFLPVFARCAHKIVRQIKTKQFYDHIMQKLEIQLNQQTIRCQVLAVVKKIWSCIYVEIVAEKVVKFALVS